MTRAPPRGDYVDLFRQVLDHALFDADGQLCGIVDDIEVSGGFGEPLRVSALLVGPGAWGPRLPAVFAGLAAWAFGTRSTRVPWEEVCELGEDIKLRSRAAALGLGTMDRRLGRLLAKLPRSDQGAP
jgi:hypothetical protein